MSFDDHFNEIYGERWPRLRAALLSDESGKVLLENPFGEDYQDYSLDAASLVPAKALEIKSGELVGDFCSAPGGKLLALIFTVRGEARFSAGELSPVRLQRLKAILHDCLPPEVLLRVEVRKGDASRWGQVRPGEFDRVLVDAPCSGERHLLHSRRELQRWSLKGSKRLAVRQNALLCSALDAVKIGGRVVYSTCSISPVENDGVIERLMKSRAGRFAVLNFSHEIGEPTKQGWIVLPDAAGCGPIYTSVIERIE